MADGLNKWIGCGNLGADPELRTTQGGSAVLNLRIACTESYLDRNNARQERTEWISCTIWGRRGEALARILKKGDRIVVEGSLRTESWEKDGEKRYATKINVTNVILCGKPQGHRDDYDDAGSSERGGGQRNQRQAGGQRSSGGGGGNSYRAPDPTGTGDSQFNDPDNFGDDQIPFVRNMTLTRGSRA